MYTSNIYSISWRSGFRMEIISLFKIAVVSLVVPSIHHHHVHMQHPFHQLEVWLQEGKNLVIRDSCGHLYIVTMFTCNIRSISWRSGFRKERISLSGTAVISLVIPSIHHHHVHMQHPFHQLEVWLQERKNLII